jgi:hypothetical protein
MSSFDMNNYAAASGSADSMYVVLHTEINGIFIVSDYYSHPADMTEQQWSIVIRDNGLLCGHNIATSKVNESDTASTVATAIERVEYPGK